MNEPASPRTIIVKESVLDKNRTIARSNRDRFDRWGCTTINLLSSPGAGKTTLLERTLSDLRKQMQLAVIVGDLATDNDARRMNDKGAAIVQINTGDICHLDAAMVARAVETLEGNAPQVCFIENVGNMVCPAAFDLGEHARVVLLCVTEGEDKPLKYPRIFHTADLVLITKTDISDAVGFNRNSALEALAATCPTVPVMEVSARTGAGLAEWYAWIVAQRERFQTQHKTAGT
jgi:hydrogenase nickel incorporation protein HypB